MVQSIGAVEACASVGARPRSAAGGPHGAITGGGGSERAVVSRRASAPDVVSRIIVHSVCVCAASALARKVHARPVPLKQTNSHADEDEKYIISHSPAARCARRLGC